MKEENSKQLTRSILNMLLGLRNSGNQFSPNYTAHMSDLSRQHIISALRATLEDQFASPVLYEPEAVARMLEAYREHSACDMDLKHTESHIERQAQLLRKTHGIELHPNTKLANQVLALANIQTHPDVKAMLTEAHNRLLEIPFPTPPDHYEITS